MTPANDAAKKAKILFTLHEYEHDPHCSSYGEEAAKKLKLNPDQVFKTLVVELTDGKLAVGVLPVNTMLNMKKIAKVAGAKKAVMATADKVQRSSGYVLGGVSPLGQKRQLPTFLHASAEQFETIFVSAGRRGLDMELAPQDLLKLTRGQLLDITD